jgi:hypothetical protein
MTKFLRFLGFYRDARHGMHMVLDKNEKKELSLIFSKPFNHLDKKDQERVLELAAKDFSGKFTGVIKELSRE